MQNKKRLIKNKRKILIFARHKMDIEANDINDFSDGEVLMLQLLGASIYVNDVKAHVCTFY